MLCYDFMIVGAIKEGSSITTSIDENRTRDSNILLSAVLTLSRIKLNATMFFDRIIKCKYFLFPSHPIYLYYRYYNYKCIVFLIIFIFQCSNAIQTRPREQEKLTSLSLSLINFRYYYNRLHKMPRIVR